MNQSWQPGRLVRPHLRAKVYGKQYMYCSVEAIGLSSTGKKTPGGRDTQGYHKRDTRFTQTSIGIQ